MGGKQLPIARFGSHEWLVTALAKLKMVCRVNGRISDRGEIWTPNFQVQYLVFIKLRYATSLMHTFS